MVAKSAADAYTTSRDLFDFTKRFIQKLPDEAFLNKKPNDNSIFEDALATMVMSAINLYIYIKDNVDEDNSLVAGILLRSLIEAAANIQYMVENKEDADMISDFLKTADTVADKLYDFKSDKLSQSIKWTKTPITERVKLLNHDSSINYLAAWHYFSSYSHSDAGYLGSHIHQHQKNMCNIILGLSCIIFIEIGESLDKAGVLKEDFNKMFYEAAQEFLNRPKKL